MSDPRPLVARYPGKCSKPGCGAAIKKGDAVFYYPKTGTILGQSCGHAEEASRAFDAARFDEEIAPRVW